MKVKLEPIFKWICLLLTVWVIADALYDWRDQRYIQQVQVSNRLATTLSQVNMLFDSTQTKLIDQINRNLELNGYGNLVRK
jgi:hypothetical protein